MSVVRTLRSSASRGNPRCPWCGPCAAPRAAAFPNVRGADRLQLRGRRQSQMSVVRTAWAQSALIRADRAIPELVTPVRRTSGNAGRETGAARAPGNARRPTGPSPGPLATSGRPGAMPSRNRPTPWTRRRAARGPSDIRVRLRLTSPARRCRSVERACPGAGTTRRRTAGTTAGPRTAPGRAGTTAERGPAPARRQATPPPRSRAPS
jgi:hypothetical protein